MSSCSTGPRHPAGAAAGSQESLDRMRERAEHAVAAGLPAREGALARGMVLGQDEEIDESTRQDWRDSGLAHLLAVSGQNVMLLVALALPLLALARLGPLARGGALLVLVALYVPLAGAGPSLQRAGIMGAAGIAAMMLSRPASRWYALLLAAAATLALSPRAARRSRLAAFVRRRRGDPRARPAAGGGARPRRIRAVPRSGPSRSHAPSSAGSPRGSRSPRRRRSRPLRSSPTTSARCRWPACSPTWSPSRRWHRRCGSG